MDQRYSAPRVVGISHKAHGRFVAATAIPGAALMLISGFDLADGYTGPAFYLGLFLWLSAYLGPRALSLMAPTLYRATRQDADGYPVWLSWALSAIYLVCGVAGAGLIVLKLVQFVLAAAAHSPPG